MPLINTHLGDGLDIYPTLPADAYTLIVSDGAYGIGGFPGDPKSPKALADWYAPHLEAWDRLAAPSSSLYFWCTPEGCARMLPHVDAAGWSLMSCLRWEKPSSAAWKGAEGMRRWMQDSEDCYFYVREAVDISALAASEVTGDLDGLTHRSVLEASGADPRNTARAFLRAEWLDRAGFSISDANRACGTATMAGHFFGRAQWQLATWEHYQNLATYAAEHAPAVDRPYLVTEAVWSRRGGLRESYEALREEYEALRYPFTLPQGVTDVWTGLPVNRTGRHSCAKRDDHTERIVTASSRPGDRVLEPFGGGAPVLRACRKLGRSCDSIEIDPEWHARAVASIETRPEATATKTQPSLFGAP